MNRNGIRRLQICMENIGRRMHTFLLADNLTLLWLVLISYITTRQNKHSMNYRRSERLLYVYIFRARIIRTRPITSRQTSALKKGKALLFKKKNAQKECSRKINLTIASCGIKCSVSCKLQSARLLLNWNALEACN